MQVVVRWVAVIMLEGASIGQAELTQQARFDEQSQGPINRGTTDLVSGIVQVPHQFIRIEVLVAIEDMANQHAPGLG